MNSFELNGRLRMRDYDARVCRLMTERSAIRAAEATRSERPVAEARAGEHQPECFESSTARRGVAAQRPA